MALKVDTKTFEQFSAEIRDTLQLLTVEIKGVADKQITLMVLMREVADLKKQMEIKEKEMKVRDEKIATLEQKIDEMEQYSRKEDLIINGLATTHLSYASRAANRSGEEISVEEQQTLVSQVIQFFASRDIQIDRKGIAACHNLPARDATKKDSIIVRFVSRSDKIEVLKQGKKLKGTTVYINEHLTRKNAEIAWEARKLRRDKKIDNTWTRDCKIMIKTNATGAVAAKVITVRKLSDLDKYK